MLRKLKVPITKKYSTNYRKLPAEKIYGLIASDFDGTLYLPECPVSQSTLRTFDRLAENKIIRVIATGRSLFSVKKVISDDFPIDYLVLSSGAVLMKWDSKEIIFSRSFRWDAVQSTVKLLQPEIRLSREAINFIFIIMEKKTRILTEDAVCMQSI